MNRLPTSFVLRTLPQLDGHILIEHGGDSESTVLDVRTFTDPGFIYEDVLRLGLLAVAAHAAGHGSGLREIDLPLDVQIEERIYQCLTEEQEAAMSLGLAVLSLSKIQKEGAEVAKELMAADQRVRAADSALVNGQNTVENQQILGKTTGEVVSLADKLRRITSDMQRAKSVLGLRARQLSRFVGQDADFEVPGFGSVKMAGEQKMDAQTSGPGGF